MSKLHKPHARHTDETRAEVARLYAQGLSVAAIEEATGVPKRTQYDWLQTPEQQLRVSAYREGLESLGAMSNAALAAKLPELTDALLAMVKSEDTPPEVRLKAIQWAHERFAPRAPQSAAEDGGRSPLHLHVTQALSAAPGEREAHMVEARAVTRQLVADAYGLSAPVQLPDGMDDRPPVEATTDEEGA